MTFFGTFKLDQSRADAISMKVSKLSPFIVIPSPEVTKEPRESKRVVKKMDTTSATEDETHTEAQHKKVVAIGKYQKEKKRSPKEPKSSKQMAISQYTKVQLAEMEFLMKDNFKKKV